MKVFTRLEHYPRDSNSPLVLGIGNFDGVHLGHERILKSVIDHAGRRKGTAGVLTFFEHPQRILHPSHEPELLTSPQHRLLLFHKSGIEVCFLLNFTIPFSKMSPEDFVKNCLVKQLGVAEVHLGYNAHFGHDRRGDALLMRELSERLSFDFYEIEPFKLGGQYISSTLIRNTIRRGDLNQAGRFLGRPFSIFASVIRGKGRGRHLGFPTANLRPHSEILPPRGVYPVEVRDSSYHLNAVIDSEEFEYEPDPQGEWKRGVLNYGVRPTFESKGEEAIPEVFLFDFSGDLYGKTVEVVFHPRLREEKSFRDAKDLIYAIERDVEAAKRYFQTSEKH